MAKTVMWAPAEAPVDGAQRAAGREAERGENKEAQLSWEQEGNSA